MYLDLNAHYVYKDQNSKRVVKGEPGRRECTFHTYYCSCGSVWEEEMWERRPEKIIKGNCIDRTHCDYIFSVPFTKRYIKFENKQGEIIGYNYIRKIEIINNTLVVVDEKVNEHELHVSFREKRMWIVTEEGKIYKSRSKINQYTEVPNGIVLYGASEDKQVDKLLKGINLYKTKCGLIGMLSSFIRHFEDDQWLQILCYSDIPWSFISEVIINQKNRYYHARNVDTRGKNPAEILQISKHNLKILKKRDYNYALYLDIRAGYNIEFADKVKKIAEKYGYANFSMYRVDEVEKLVKCGYDLERLIKYVVYDIDRLQGISNPSTGVSLLYDTVRMHKDMKTKMHEKYPKSLKLRHDIATRDYKMVRDKIIEEKFIEKCKEEQYLNMIYEDKEYFITTPKYPSDLVKEGREMGHCVASYVKSVAQGQTKIYFLRKKSSPNESYVTIELNNDNSIIQAKGRGNTQPDDEVFNFINKWRKERHLTYRNW